MNIASRLKKLEAAAGEQSLPGLAVLIPVNHGENTEDKMNAWRAEHPGQEPTLWIALVPLSPANRDNTGLALEVKQ